MTEKYRSEKEVLRDKAIRALIIIRTATFEMIDLLPERNRDKKDLSLDKAVCIMAKEIREL